MTVGVESDKHEQPARPLPRVLVSILTYNSPDDAGKTLQCLSRQTYPQLRLQIIDNASTNDCVAQIAQAFPTVEIKVLPQNLGYTGGNNVALRQALAEGYDYVIICNHDIEVDERAIGLLIETAEANQDAGVVGGIETNLAGQIRSIDGGRYCPWISRARKCTEVKATDPDCPWVKVPCVHGALILFTRRALDLGLFLDENLFMYMDEIDIGFQLKQRGLQAYTDRRILIRHKSEPYQLDEYVGYLSQRNRLYLVKKHGSWYHRIFYHLYALLVELPVKTIVRSLQGHPGFAQACIIGHFDAMRGNMGRDRVKDLLTLD